MSLLCGNHRGYMGFEFGMLYLLGRNQEGMLLLPETPDKKYVAPNSAVCDECWAKVPDSAKVKDEKDILKLRLGKDSVFAFAQATSGDSGFGTPSFMGILPKLDSLVYMTKDMVSQYLPKALEIIEEENQASLDTEFLDDLRKYFFENKDKFKPILMAWLAHGVLGVFDSWGEWDAYFDTERWDLSHPEIWTPEPGKPSVVFRPGLKKIQAGVLEGIGTTMEIKDWYALAIFAKGQLKSPAGLEWLTRFHDLQMR